MCGDIFAAARLWRARSRANGPTFTLMRSAAIGREMCSFIPEVTPRAPTRLKTRGSRLGSLYYDKITTLAILPRRIRHDQPNESRQRPCDRAAGWKPPAARLARPLLPREGQEHGVARWWGRHAATQLEHMPSQWCTGCGERTHRGGGKTPLCAPDIQGPQSSRLPACWRGRKADARARHGCVPR
jgi:hypothetical protein